MGPDRGAVVCERRYDGSSKKWGPWKTMMSREQGILPVWFSLDLPKGGNVCVQLNAISVLQQNALAQALRACPHFRQYKIQGSPEPRVHFLMHREATNDWADPQPGYQYGSIRLKSIPLDELEEVCELADMMESLYNEEYGNKETESNFWNIGVDCIMYRSGRDRMGYHADDDQGETLVLTVLISTPESSVRRIHIRPANTDQIQHDDVEVMLYLGAGDAYSMDDEMQKHYHHGVPRDKNSIGEGEQDVNQRIAIVLRHGLFKVQERDSGQPCNSLEPRVLSSYIFGGYTQFQTLREGNVYTRDALYSCHAHRAHQRGVSGNQNVGCDSIVVSGLRPDGMGADNLFSLMYAASAKEGALSLLHSARAIMPVRVMRSNILNSEYRALNPNSVKKASSQLYRYDGVYKIHNVMYRDPNSYRVETYRLLNSPDAVVPQDRVFLFFLERSREMHGTFGNSIRKEDYVQFCINNGTMAKSAPASLALDCPLPFLDGQATIDLLDPQTTAVLALVSMKCSIKHEPHPRRHSVLLPFCANDSAPLTSETVVPMSFLQFDRHGLSKLKRTLEMMQLPIPSLYLKRQSIFLKKRQTPSRSSSIERPNETGENAGVKRRRIYEERPKGLRSATLAVKMKDVQAKRDRLFEDHSKGLRSRTQNVKTEDMQVKRRQLNDERLKGLRSMTPKQKTEDTLLKRLRSHKATCRRQTPQLQTSPSITRPRQQRSSIPTDQVSTDALDAADTVSGVIASLSLKYRKMMGQIGFAPWKKLPTPVLIVSPLEAPQPVRDNWLAVYHKEKEKGNLKQMCYLVYWYGAAERDAQMYGFVMPRSFIPYEVEQAKAKSACKPPGRIQHKVASNETLNAKDESVLRAYRELEEDLRRNPTERKRGLAPRFVVHGKKPAPARMKRKNTLLPVLQQSPSFKRPRVLRSVTPTETADLRDADNAKAKRQHIKQEETDRKPCPESGPRRLGDCKHKPDKKLTRSEDSRSSPRFDRQQTSSTQKTRASGKQTTVAFKRTSPRLNKPSP